MTKPFHNLKTTTKLLKKKFKTIAKKNHDYKSSIKKAIASQKEKHDKLFKDIKTLQDQFDDLPKPVTFKQEISYYNLNANLLSIYLQLSQELYYLNELEKAYKEGYNDAKR